MANRRLWAEVEGADAELGAEPDAEQDADVDEELDGDVEPVWVPTYNNPYTCHNSPNRPPS